MEALQNNILQTEKTGAQLLVECLAVNGVNRISCVAGESYLAVLDALLDYPKIDVTTCRHEGAAAFMAESMGKLTGRPGICFVTRGPGACNASIGVHTAMQDSTPMILFMGQVARKDKGKEAFQEIDVANVFGNLAKWATEIDDPARIPEIISRAFQIAMSGRPGPVAIGLPEDMLVEITKACSLPSAEKVSAHASAAAIKNVKAMLKSASKPMAIVGGSGWSDEAITQFMDFANANKIPVATSFRRQDLFDHNNQCYIGELGTGPNPALLQSVRDADLLLVVGARLNEIMTQGYTLLESANAGQKLVHIFPDAKELNKLYKADLAILSDMDSAATALAGGVRHDGRQWADWRKTLRTQYEAWSTIDLTNRPAWRGADMTVIFDFLRNHLPKDAIITTDAGNFSGWAQRYLRYGRPNRLLAPVAGAMGYAVPSVIAASIAHPERVCLGLCGDGGFMMTGQDIATAIHHKARPIIMVCNNNMYGTIRMHQEREYPGRISATGLTNPDFAMLAKSYGALGMAVDDAGNFPAAWKDAIASDKPVLIEIRMDPKQITTNAGL